MGLARALCCAAILVAGCNKETVFPPGLEPLEPNTAPAPGAAGDPFPEVLSVVTGKTNDYDWGHARAFVKATPASVWKALRDPAVVTDRHGTDKQEVTLGTEPQYAFSFQLHYTVSIASWTESWRYGAVEGSFEDPELGMVRYQKIDGTYFIEVIEGSLMVKSVEDHPDVTALELVNHMKTPQIDIPRVLNNQYSSLLAKVRGQPLP